MTPTAKIDLEKTPFWMRATLLLAAVYNLAWGGWVVLRPDDLFAMAGILPPRYPGIWQCVGMIVGVYGIGYAIASVNPWRHWPIVLVGLLGKVFGPLGFAWQMLSPATEAQLPPAWGWVIATNDLIWWIPFSVILYQVFRHSNAPGETEVMTISEANRRFQSQHGCSVTQLSADTDTLLLFLRHSGCTFCREALADVARQREQLEAGGIVLVLIHMGTDQDAAKQFAAYGLQDVHRISDPECVLYRSYGLQRGRFLQLFGPEVWWPGFRAAILGGHGVGKLGGDGFQLGGVFLVRDDRVIRAYRHKSSAGRPDYCSLPES